MYLTFMKGDSIQRQGRHIPSVFLTMIYEENTIHQNADYINYYNKECGRSLTLAAKWYSQGPWDVGWGVTLGWEWPCRAMHLVIVHDCVQGFNPQGVDVPIQDQPGWPLVPEVCLLSQNGWEEACKIGAKVANTVEGRVSLKYVYVPWKLLLFSYLSRRWHAMAFLSFLGDSIQLAPLLTSSKSTCAVSCRGLRGRGHQGLYRGWHTC